MAPLTDGLAPWIRPDEQCIALARGVRLIQRLRGHRYSVDDMLVAHLAGSTGLAPRRALDLGCGLGSVLLLLAWSRPEAELVGLEALAEHAALARRNLVLNGCEGRARVVEGDLRDEALLAGLGAFDLVTGTPPYFEPRTGTVCADPQRAAAQWELRGGIEDYARAARRTLSPKGRFVVCASASPEGRALAALRDAGLHPSSLRPVYAKEGRCRPFLLLLTAAREAPGRLVSGPPLILRRADGTRTDEHAAIRGWTGVPCGPR